MNYELLLIIIFGSILGIVLLMAIKTIISLCKNNDPTNIHQFYIFNNTLTKPFDIVTNTDTEKVCTICLDLIGDVECRLKCGHGYHYNCIKEWAHTQRNNNCPQCRTILIEV